MPWLICSQNRKVKAEGPGWEKQVVELDREQKEKNDGTEQLSKRKESRIGEVQRGTVEFGEGGIRAKSTDK